MQKELGSRHIVFSLLIAAFIILVVPAIVIAAHSYGEPEVVDETGDVGRYASAAVQPTTGYPAAAYYDLTNASLRFALWNGATWDTETVVDGGLGQYTAIEFDATGDAYIAYYNTIEGDLEVAYNGSGSWVTQDVDTLEDVGIDNSIAIDSNGYPHITYNDSSNDDLKYARYDGSTWDISVIDSTGDTGLFSSLVLDSLDGPHVSYYNWTDSHLQYAVWDGSEWDIEVVDSSGNSGFDTSLALDATGDPHISYRQWVNSDLKYAHKSDSVWDVQTLDETGDVGHKTSLVVNSDGYPRISYLDIDNAALKYAAWDGDQWILNFVEVGVTVGEVTSMAIDTTGDSHIVYYDAANSALRYINLNRWADVEAPAVNLRINGGAANTNVTAVSLELVCTDQATGCDQMRISTDQTFDATPEEDWMAYDSPHPWALATGDGTKTVFVQMMDGQGNVTGDSDSILLDTISPDAAVLSSPANGSWVTANPTFGWVAASDAGAGIDHYELWINGALGRDNIASGTLSATPATALTEGVKSWSVRAEDGATNYTDSSQRSVTVDTGTPTGDVIASSSYGSAFADTTSITLDVTCSDPSGTYRSGCDGGAMRFGNSAPSGGWSTIATFPTRTTHTLSAGDGLKTIYGELRDLAGNLVSIQDSIILDTTAPVATVSVNGGGSFTNSTNVTLDVTCTDAGIGCDSMKFSNNGVSFSSSEDVVTPKLWDLTTYGGDTADGVKTVSGRFSDLFGRESTVTDQVTLDRVSPTGSVVVSGDATYVGSTTVKLNLDCNDDRSGCDEMRLSNTPDLTSSAWEAYATQKASWSIPSGDGLKTVYAQFKDNAENASEPADEDYVILDTTAPSAFGLLTPDSGSWQGDSPVFSWQDSSDDASGLVEYELYTRLGSSSEVLAIDGIAPGVTSDTLSGPLSEGSYTWYVKAKDAMGNSRTASPSRTFQVDLTAPGVELTVNDSSGYTNGNVVDLQITCSDGAGSGCDEMRFSNTGDFSGADLSASAWERFSTTKASWDLDSGIGVTGDGVRPVFVQVRDEIDNIGTDGDSTIIDTLAPSAFNALLPADGAWTKERYEDFGAPQFSWQSTTDNPTGSPSGLVEYELHIVPVGSSADAIARDGIATTDTTATAQADSRIQLEEQQYDWFVRAWDLAGNYTDTPIRQIGYDETAPSGTVLIDGGSTYTTDLNMTLDVTCTDAASGCSQVSFSTDLINWSTPDAISEGAVYQLAYSMPSTQDSITPVYYVMTDDAGNGSVAGTQYALIQLDRTAPSVGVPAAPKISSDLSATKYFTVSGWNTGAVDPPYGSGIQNYDVQWRVKGTSTRKLWKSATTASSAKFWASTLGKNYCFRARARDYAGNVSSYSAERCTAVPYDNKATSISYSTGWTSSTIAGAYQSSLKTATKKGAKFTFKFTGKQVSFIAKKTAKSGKAKVYIDGVYWKTVDLYSATTQNRKQVASRVWGKSGRHKITVILTGTKNAKSKGTGVSFDALGVIY